MKKKLKTIWKDDYGYIHPSLIQSVIVILVIFVITIFIVGILSNLGDIYNPRDQNSLVSGRFSGTLDVTDPGRSQCWDINVDGEMILVQQILTDGTILTIDTGDWSYSNQWELCVTEEGLWG